MDEQQINALAALGLLRMHISTKYSEHPRIVGAACNLRAFIELCGKNEIEALQAENARLREQNESFKTILDTIAELSESGHITTSNALREALEKIDALTIDKNTTCPKCGGVADNGFDREIPPNPYTCTMCAKTTEE